MTSKSKLVVAFSTLGVVCLGAIIACVFAFAAGTQSFKSNVTVSYIASEIAGSVSATYKVGAEGEVVKMTTDGQAPAQDNSNTIITFTADTDNSASLGTLAPLADIELSKTNKTVTFTYSFTNTGDHDYTATLVETVTANNLERESTPTGLVVTVPAATAGVAGTATYSITYTISDLAKDAGFENGQYSWTLAKA